MQLQDAWNQSVWEIVTEAKDAVDVAEKWNALMDELSVLGIDELESDMTIKFFENLERYHAAGYFMDIQPEA